MSDVEELGSDSSDDDYVPSDGEAVSEEEGSGDEEDTGALVKDAEGETSEVTNKKRGKAKQKIVPARKRAGGIKLDEVEEENDKDGKEEEKINFDEEEKKAKEMEKEVKEKKKSDDLWASFMSDVGGPPPRARAGSGIGALSAAKKPGSSTVPAKSALPASKPAQPAPSSKVTITKEFDFAGERIKVTKEVDANSSEAKSEQKQSENQPTSSRPALGVKRPAGLSGLMGKLGKAPKISTLDKSKLDWQNFKEENKLTEELTTHNRGKEGFLERKAFLERTDLRQFEIEKSLRLSNSKR